MLMLIGVWFVACSGGGQRRPVDAGPPTPGGEVEEASVPDGRPGLTSNVSTVVVREADRMCESTHECQAVGTWCCGTPWVAARKDAAEAIRSSVDWSLCAAVSCSVPVPPAVVCDGGRCRLEDRP